MEAPEREPDIFLPHCDEYSVCEVRIWYDEKIFQLDHSVGGKIACFDAGLKETDNPDDLLESILDSKNQNVFPRSWADIALSFLAEKELLNTETVICAVCAADMPEKGTCKYCAWSDNKEVS